MAVVINDFEVVPQAQEPATRSAESSSTSSGGAQEKIKREELERALRQIKQRLARVRAH